MVRARSGVDVTSVGSNLEQWARIALTASTIAWIALYAYSLSKNQWHFKDALYWFAFHGNRRWLRVLEVISLVGLVASLYIIMICELCSWVEKMLSVAVISVYGVVLYFIYNRRGKNRSGDSYDDEDK